MVCAGSFGIEESKFKTMDNSPWIFLILIINWVHDPDETAGKNRHIRQSTDRYGGHRA